MQKIRSNDFLKEEKGQIWIVFILYLYGIEVHKLTWE